MNDESGILVVGTGAMACAIGARLARAGAAPTLAGTWPAALDAIAAHGLLVHDVLPAPRGPQAIPARDSEGERWSVPARVERIDHLEASFPLALVLVKSRQTAAVATLLERALAPFGLALTLQNGLGNRETLATALGPSRVALGVAIMGATLLAPGEVRADAGRVVLGLEPATAERIASLAEILRSAGIAVETTTQIELALWRKLVANCAINPLTALHGLTNGALLEDPELVAQMVAAAREVGAVAAAKGLRIQGDPGQVAFEVARATGENRSSMLQDLERGNPTEIDAMNAAVIREARNLGVATPVNERLCRLVRERERKLREEGA